MPKFRVCVVETREYIHEIEADDRDDAEDQAKTIDAADGSQSDCFREQTVDWVEEIEA